MRTGCNAGSGGHSDRAPLGQGGRTSAFLKHPATFVIDVHAEDSLRRAAHDDGWIAQNTAVHEVIDGPCGLVRAGFVRALPVKQMEILARQDAAKAVVETRKQALSDAFDREIQIRRTGEQCGDLLAVFWLVAEFARFDQRGHKSHMFPGMLVSKGLPDHQNLFRVQR